MTKAVKKFLSSILAIFLIASLSLPNDLSQMVYASTDTYYGPTVNSDGTVTLYYVGSEDDTAVRVKGSWKDDWSDSIDFTKGSENLWTATIPTEKFTMTTASIQYGIVHTNSSVTDEWVGDPMNPTSPSGNSVIYRNPRANTDGSVTIYYYPDYGTEIDSDALFLLYRPQGSTNTEYDQVAFSLDTYSTNVYSATISDSIEAGTYEYLLSVNGVQIADSDSADGTFNITDYPEKDEDIISPVVTQDNITFYYYSPTATTVYLAGSMNEWSSSSDAMEYDSSTGYWSITKELDPGIYQYKYVVDGTWTQDPLNSLIGDGDNSKVIMPGLATASVDATKGDTITLPETLAYYNEDGVSVDVSVSYTDPELTSVSISGCAITIEEEYTGSNTIELTAMDEDGHSSVVDVNIQSQLYTYNIYFYSPDLTMEPGISDLYIYENATGATRNTVVDFAGTYEDTTNNITWLTATVSLPYSSLGVIARDTAGTWSGGQDSNRYAVMPDDQTTTDLYYVYGEDITYTLPEVDTTASVQRHIMFTYINADGQDDWNFYTWNNGYGTETIAFTRQDDGTLLADVPVKSSISSISFCIMRNDWEEKDGGDHSISIPLEQNCVKYTMSANEEPVLSDPYNLGSEIDPANDCIHYYYRDDDLYADNTTEASISKVELVQPGEVHEMTWDSEDQRFEYTQTGLTTGNYYYGYQITGANEDSTLTYVLDRFVDTIETIDDVTYSCISYKKYNATVSASLQASSINSDTNDVLTVAVETAADEDDMTVQSVTADISALGGSNEFVIDPELMAGTLSVDETIPTGTYEIPITVCDQYENQYTTTISIQVAQEDTSDIDWDESIIYFVLTDRFFNGNTTNDTANGEETYGDNPGLQHGGDFVGLTAKLDYLQDLGVNTIWISPIVEQIAGVTVTGDGSEDVPYNASYHGYWANDFTKLNPALGTEEEFQTFINTAHEKGIKIMVDVVLNHAGYGTEDNEWFQGMFRTTNVSGSDILSSLSNLPDFMTELSDVREKLITWQTQWVKDYGIDYFRVDTAKHVDTTTLADFKNTLTEIDPEFKMIGEYSGAGYSSTFGMLGTGIMDSLLDFDYNGIAADFVSGKLDQTEAFLEKRNESITSSATLGSFLSSHDEDGFLYDQGGSDDEQAIANTMVAASLQMTSKGQVVIYYGEELGQTGANDYPYQTNRYDFDWSSVSSDNEMYEHYKTLLSIRNDYLDVLSKGTREKLTGSDEDNYLVFSRSYEDEELVVGLNISSEAKTVEVTVPYTSGTVLEDKYNQVTYDVSDNQTIELEIPAANDGGTAILAVKTEADTTPTPTKTPSSGSSSNSTVVTPTPEPTTTPITTTPTPSPTSIPTEEIGTQKTINNALYEVTKSEKTKHTVTYVKSVGQNKRSLLVPSAIYIDGVKYQVTAIAKNAFVDDTKLTCISIGENIKTIGANAFKGCTSLKFVKLGDDITKINANAFSGCTSLTSIELPSQITTIGKNAFMNCSSLKEINITTEKLSTVKTKAFSGIFKKAIITVPKGKLEDYTKLLQAAGLKKTIEMKEQ